MKFQFSLGHLAILTMLAAGTVTFPAAAEDRAPEPARQDPAPESAEKSRDAKSTSAAKPAIDSRTEGARNGLQIRVEPKGDAPPPDSGESTTCTDCEVKLPAASAPPIAGQVAPQATVGKDLGAPPPLNTPESDSNRQRLGHALGIGGIVAAALGSYMTIGAIAAGDGTPTAVLSGRNGFFFAGLASIAIGGGLVVGGFSLAAANNPPSTAADRMPAPPQQRRGATDMGVSLTGKF